MATPPKVTSEVTLSQIVWRLGYFNLLRTELLLYMKDSRLWDRNVGACPLRLLLHIGEVCLGAGTAVKSWGAFVSHSPVYMVSAFTPWKIKTQ